MKRTFQGGCHCGAVRFAVDLDLSRGTDKCNCSICRLARAWFARASAEDFRLLSGAEDLTDYRFDTGQVHHYFCRRCGVRAFEWVDIPSEDLRYYNIAIVCLADLDVDAVMAAPVKLQDGANDRWDREPADPRLM